MHYLLILTKKKYYTYYSVKAMKKKSYVNYFVIIIYSFECTKVIWYTAKSKINYLTECKNSV